MAVEMILGEMIVKSLKQREQLEGYRRDTYLKKYDSIKEFKRILSNDGKGSLIMEKKEHE